MVRSLHQLFVRSQTDRCWPFGGTQTEKQTPSPSCSGSSLSYKLSSTSFFSSLQLYVRTPQGGTPMTSAGSFWQNMLVPCSRTLRCFALQHWPDDSDFSTMAACIWLHLERFEQWQLRGRLTMATERAQGSEITALYYPVWQCQQRSAVLNWSKFKWLASCNQFFPVPELFFIIVNIEKLINS